MNAKTKALCEAKARIIKALGHPSRVFMVEELLKGERCVCELTEMIGADVSTVSKHLSLLKNAGIVTDDKRGSQVFYSLRVPCILNFFGCVESMLQAKGDESLQIEGQKNDLGKGAIVDALAAQAALLEAETNYYRALAEVRVARAQNLATGDLVE